jgi:hypothetical protein
MKYDAVNAGDVKKPSEIAQENAGAEARDTGRPTDLKELENQTQFVKDKSAGTNYVCCCIDPYITDKTPPYPTNLLCRDGDVFKHRAHFKSHVVCFNICYKSDHASETVIVRASDGTVAKGVTVDDLSNMQKYFLVRSEKCNLKHHGLKRLSFHGRLLVYLCTVQGLFSTCKQVCCCDDCITYTNVETVRCERSLYSKRGF